MSRAQLVVVSIYFGLLVLLILTAVGSSFISPLTREALLPVVVDGIKTVLAALVGALSVVLGARLPHQSSDDTRKERQR
jgi:hypothetical protein